jgi:cobalt-zinc-cadmium efflux system outer membrane protein
MFIRKLVTRCVLIATVVVLICVDVSQASAESSVLTLNDAISRAIAENPALRGSEYLLLASHAREARVAQSPPLSVGAEFEDFAGSGDLSGVDSLQTTLRLSGVLELGGKRAARGEMAQRETEVVSIDQTTERLDLLAQVAERFAQVAARQERLVVAHQATELSAATVDRVTERIRVGAAPQHELGRAEISLSRARIDEEHAEHQLTSGRVRLAATWGETAPQFARVSANLFEFPETKTLEQLMDDVDASPAIQRMLSRERLAAAQLNLARTARSSEIVWSAGLRRLESIDDSALVGSITLPLGTRRRAEPSISEVEAMHAKFPFDVQAARVEAGSILFELYQELHHAKLEARTLREQVQPQSQSVLQLTELSFRQGRVTFFELASAQQQLLDVRRDAIAAAAEYHALLIEIERLMGRSIVADTHSGDAK